MADQNSSLPVKTLNNGDIAAKIVDGTVTSQALTIDSAGRVTSKLNDGAGNSVTSQTNGAQRALDVGVNVAGVQIDPRQIRALTAADIVTAAQGAPNTSTNRWPVQITDGTNLATVLATGEQKVSVTQLLTEDHNFGTVGASTLRTAAEIGNATGAANFANGATGAQTLRVAANLAIAGADVTSLNPIPVVLSASVSGTIVNNYNTAAAVAAGATSNHTYTITSTKSFQGKKIHAASAGSMKIEVQTSADGVTFATVFVAFNSSANPSIDIDMDEILFLQAAGAGAAIRIIRTNREVLLAEDLYSTISGVEV